MIADPSVRWLVQHVEPFAELYRKNGAPPGWRRPATFGTLVRFVLEQQVSLASARAAYERLEAAIGEPRPARLLELTDDAMRRIGFSRQKTRYAREIATRMESGALDLDRVLSAGDGGVSELLAVPGIGPWTVGCVRLFVAGDPDVWPIGDRALHVSLAHVFALDGVPSSSEAAEIARRWRPHRSTAARFLWHEYLGGHAYTGEDQAGFIVDDGMVPP